jgi:adenylylsulfate kinase
MREMIYWFTGQPGSGKTTLARRVAEIVGAVVIDGDVVRRVYPESFDKPGRQRNVRRAQDMAQLLDREGYDVCVSVVAPYREQREMFKRKCPVTEIYLYSTRPHPHVVEAYEPPVSPDLALDTDAWSVEICVSKVVEKALHIELACP